MILNSSGVYMLLGAVLRHWVVSDSATTWTAACQAPLPMEFSRQEYWGGLPFPTPGHLPNSGAEPTSAVPPALAGGFFTAGATWKALTTKGPLISPLWGQLSQVFTHDTEGFARSTASSSVPRKDHPRALCHKGRLTPLHIVQLGWLH